MRISGILEAITLNIILLNFKLEGVTLWRYKIKKKRILYSLILKNSLQKKKKTLFSSILQEKGVARGVELIFKNVLYIHINTATAGYS